MCACDHKYLKDNLPLKSWTPIYFNPFSNLYIIIDVHYFMLQCPCSLYQYILSFVEANQFIAGKPGQDSYIWNAYSISNFT